jgi:Egh16-like virulence factor
MSTSGALPSCSSDGVVTMTFHQVNGDGAGPLTADIDYTSGGTDASAFKQATVLQNVPGTNSRSGARAQEFTVEVQMPQGATCNGTAGGANNLCVVRVRNAAKAGPFGGSGVFTMPETQGTNTTAPTKMIRAIGEIISFVTNQLQGDESPTRNNGTDDENGAVASSLE